MFRALSKKGSLLPFFLCLFMVSYLHPIRAESNETGTNFQRASLIKLAQEPVWRALLHANKDKFLINDPNFLLSWPNVSLENEIIATYKALKLPIQPNVVHAQCRFPARFKWIRENLSIETNEFPFIECQDYLEYQQRAPADTIKLVFASENVSSPSSMMGHSFIVLEGINAKGSLVTHGVSYYTVLDSYNIPKIIIESLLTGMTGLFSLTPYQQIKKRYIESEGRNVWEYDLNISDTDKAMIHAHIWELKNAKSDYYFHAYNCATLTHFLLAVVAPEILTNDRLWISPSDVVKDATEFGLIQRSKMTPSNRWKIKMLVDQMKSDQVSNVYYAVKQAESIQDFHLLETNDRVLGLELYKSYVAYLAQRQEIYQERLMALQNNFLQMDEVSFKDNQLDLSEYKNPIKTPDDTQFSLSYGQVEGRSFVQFGFLPTAHRFQDDNRQYFTENELRLAEIHLRFLPDKQSISLQECTLYSVKSINPWDRFTGGFSAQWEIGFEPHYGDSLEMHKAFNLEAASGLALAPHHDMMFYGMLGAGYGYGAGRHYLYSSPEAGIVINELFNFKSIIKTRHIYNQLDSGRGFWDIEFTQSWFPSQEFGLFLNSRLRADRDEHEMTVVLSYTTYF